jgi:hypothetical protein
MSSESTNSSYSTCAVIALSRIWDIGGFLKVFRVQNGKFVLVMSQGMNFVVTSQRIFHFGGLDAY